MLEQYLNSTLLNRQSFLLSRPSDSLRQCARAQVTVERERMEASSRDAAWSSDIVREFGYQFLQQNVSEAKVCNDHLLPDPSLLKFSQFHAFIEERRRILHDKLRDVLS